MKIQDLDLPLVKEFIKREAQDFRHRLNTQEKTNNWVDNLLSKINAGLSSEHGKANYLSIKSLSNVGLLNRQLVLTPDPWGPKGMVVVTLCTCGNLECWGTISFPNGKKIGKKGVQPLFE